MREPHSLARLKYMELRAGNQHFQGKDPTKFHIRWGRVLTEKIKMESIVHEMKKLNYENMLDSFFEK